MSLPEFEVRVMILPFISSICFRNGFYCFYNRKGESEFQLEWILKKLAMLHAVQTASSETNLQLWHCSLLSFIHEYAYWKYFSFRFSFIQIIFRSNHAMESCFPRYWNWITKKWSTENKQQKENGQWFSSERFREFSMGIHYAGRKCKWKRLKGML